MGDVFDYSARFMDLSTRTAYSTTVAASPATTTATNVCQATIPGGLSFASGVWCHAQIAVTTASNTTTMALAIYRTSIATANLVATTGALAVASSTLVELAINTFDTSPGTAGIYLAALTPVGATATSTVSQVGLFALCI